MDSNTNLQQGLEAFHQKNSKYFSEKAHSEKGEAFLRSHDIAHVVFGCDTSLYGEGVVKIWTTFGTTLSFWEVTSGYREASAFELSRQFSFRHVSKNLPRLLGAIPKVIIRAKRMRKPWPFAGYEPYLNMPITEIRKEFNILVV